MTLIGAGSMGGAMLKGWVAQGQSRVIDVVEPFPQAWLTDLAATGHIALNPAPRLADIVVLAVKPRELPAIPCAGLLAIRLPEARAVNKHMFW